MKMCAPSCVVLCASHRHLHPWTSSEAKQATEGRRNVTILFSLLLCVLCLFYILHLWECKCIAVYLHINHIQYVQGIAFENTIWERTESNL